MTGETSGDRPVPEEGTAEQGTDNSATAGSPKSPNRLLENVKAILRSDSGFARLAKSHAFILAGDALVALALADSVFFSINPADARWRVGLYLLLTVAPFAVVAQFLGPLLERLSGGTRFVLIGAGFGRAVVAAVMAFYVTSFWFFPMAFALLVLGKAHHIAKSSLVPGLVNDESKLVQANSRLSIISAIAGGLAAIPGGILFWLSGAPAILALASIVFGLGGILAFAIPKVQVLVEPETPQAASAGSSGHLRRGGIRLAGSAMAYVRGVSGFLTMLLAFALRGGVDPGPAGAGVDLGHRVRESFGLVRLDLSVGGSPTWHFGAVLAATGLGGLIGAITSPHLRVRFPEKRILAGMLGLMSIVGLLGALAGGLMGSMMVGFAVAFGGAVGKQSFDAIVQRDAPAEELGHHFARFESQFQLIWVLGALIPVVLPIPVQIGFLLLALTAGFASITYGLGRDPAPKTDRARAQVKSVGTKVGTRVGSSKVGARVGTKVASRNRKRPKDSPPTVTSRPAPDRAADPTTEHPITPPAPVPPPIIKPVPDPTKTLPTDPEATRLMPIVDPDQPPPN